MLSTKDRERFWSKVDRAPGQGPNGACWEWTGAKKNRGYGRFQLDGSARGAHRVAFWLKYGHCPVVVMHRCDNPACCRPDHLEDGDWQKNVDDMWAKGRGASKLTPGEAQEICDRYEAGGVSQRELASEYGITQPQVNRIVNRKQWA